jgi:uncharacterized membrane protein YqjE
MASDADRSLSTIVQDIVGNVQGILRSEIRLAKTEIREEANKAARASTLFISGGVLGIYAVGLLLLTLVRALSVPLEPWLAALIVFVVVAVLSAVLLRAGIARFRRVNPTPDRTIETMKENVQWVKNQGR